MNNNNNRNKQQNSATYQNFTVVGRGERAHHHHHHNATDHDRQPQPSSSRQTTTTTTRQSNINNSRRRRHNHGHDDGGDDDDDAVGFMQLCQYVEKSILLGDDEAEAQVGHGGLAAAHDEPVDGCTVEVENGDGGGCDDDEIKMKDGDDIIIIDGMIVPPTNSGGPNRIIMGGRSPSDRSGCFFFDYSLYDTCLMPTPTPFSPSPSLSFEGDQQQQQRHQQYQQYHNIRRRVEEKGEEAPPTPRRERERRREEKRDYLRRVDSEFVPQFLCGLHNCGNTCFANSALQNITAFPSLITALRYSCPVTTLMRVNMIGRSPSSFSSSSLSLMPSSTTTNCRRPGLLPPPRQEAEERRIKANGESAEEKEEEFDNSKEARRKRRKLSGGGGGGGEKHVDFLLPPLPEPCGDLTTHLISDRRQTRFQQGIDQQHHYYIDHHHQSSPTTSTSTSTRGPPQVSTPVTTTISTDDGSYYNKLHHRHRRLSYFSPMELPVAESFVALTAELQWGGDLYSAFCGRDDDLNFFGQSRRVYAARLKKYYTYYGVESEKLLVADDGDGEGGTGGKVTVLEAQMKKYNHHDFEEMVERAVTKYGPEPGAPGSPPYLQHFSIRQRVQNFLKFHNCYKTVMPKGHFLDPAKLKKEQDAKNSKKKQPSSESPFFISMMASIFGGGSGGGKGGNDENDKKEQQKKDNKEENKDNDDDDDEETNPVDPTTFFNDKAVDVVFAKFLKKMPPPKKRKEEDGGGGGGSDARPKKKQGAGPTTTTDFITMWKWLEKIHKGKEDDIYDPVTGQPLPPPRPPTPPPTPTPTPTPPPPDVDGDPEAVAASTSQEHDENGEGSRLEKIIEARGDDDGAAVENNNDATTCEELPEKARGTECEEPSQKGQRDEEEEDAEKKSGDGNYLKLDPATGNYLVLPKTGATGPENKDCDGDDDKEEEGLALQQKQKQKKKKSPYASAYRNGTRIGGEGGRKGEKGTGDGSDADEGPTFTYSSSCSSSFCSTSSLCSSENESSAASKKSWEGKKNNNKKKSFHTSIKTQNPLFHSNSIRNSNKCIASTTTMQLHRRRHHQQYRRWLRQTRFVASLAPAPTGIPSSSSSSSISVGDQQQQQNKQLLRRLRYSVGSYGNVRRVTAPKHVLKQVSNTREQFAKAYKAGTQQDAGEWLLALLDSIQECSRTEAHLEGLLRLGSSGFMWYNSENSDRNRNSISNRDAAHTSSSLSSSSSAAPISSPSPSSFCPSSSSAYCDESPAGGKGIIKNNSYRGDGTMSTTRLICPLQVPVSYETPSSSSSKAKKKTTTGANSSNDHYRYFDDDITTEEGRKKRNNDRDHQQTCQNHQISTQTTEVTKSFMTAVRVNTYCPPFGDGVSAIPNSVGPWVPTNTTTTMNTTSLNNASSSRRRPPIDSSHSPLPSSPSPYPLSFTSPTAAVTGLPSTATPSTLTTTTCPYPPPPPPSISTFTASCCHDHHRPRAEEEEGQEDLQAVEPWQGCLFTNHGVHCTDATGGQSVLLLPPDFFSTSSPVSSSASGTSAPTASASARVAKVNHQRDHHIAIARPDHSQHHLDPYSYKRRPPISRGSIAQWYGWAVQYRIEAANAREDFQERRIKYSRDSANYRAGISQGIIGVLDPPQSPPDSFDKFYDMTNILSTLLLVEDYGEVLRRREIQRQLKALKERQREVFTKIEQRQKRIAEKNRRERLEREKKLRALEGNNRKSNMKTKQRRSRKPDLDDVDGPDAIIINIYDQPVADYVPRVRRLYQKYELWDKMWTVKAMLRKNAGKDYEKLIQALVKKLGPEPTADETLPSPPPTSNDASDDGDDNGDDDDTEAANGGTAVQDQSNSNSNKINMNSRSLRWRKRFEEEGYMKIKDAAVINVFDQSVDEYAVRVNRLYQKHREWDKMYTAKLLLRKHLTKDYETLIQALAKKIGGPEPEPNETLPTPPFSEDDADDAGKEKEGEENNKDEQTDKLDGDDDDDDDEGRASSSGHATDVGHTADSAEDLVAGGQVVGDISTHTKAVDSVASASAQNLKTKMKQTDETSKEEAGEEEHEDSELLLRLVRQNRAEEHALLSALKKHNHSHHTKATPSSPVSGGSPLVGGGVPSPHLQPLPHQDGKDHHHPIDLESLEGFDFPEMIKQRELKENLGVGIDIGQTVRAFGGLWSGGLRRMSSPLSDLVQGTQINTITCHTCGHRSRMCNYFSSLSLAFPTADTDRLAYIEYKEECRRRRRRQQRTRLHNHCFDTATNRKKSSSSSARSSAYQHQQQQQQPPQHHQQHQRKKNKKKTTIRSFFDCLISMGRGGAGRANKAQKNGGFSQEKNQAKSAAAHHKHGNGDDRRAAKKERDERRSERKRRLQQAKSAPLTLDELFWFNYSQPEILSKENSYFCMQCQKVVPRASRVTEFLELPDILIIMLKRFTFDGGDNLGSAGAGADGPTGDDGNNKKGGGNLAKKFFKGISRSKSGGKAAKIMTPVVFPLGPLRGCGGGGSSTNSGASAATGCRDQKSYGVGAGYSRVNDSGAATATSLGDTLRWIDTADDQALSEAFNNGHGGGSGSPATIVHRSEGEEADSRISIDDDVDGDNSDGGHDDDGDILDLAPLMALDLLCPQPCAPPPVGRANPGSTVKVVTTTMSTTTTTTTTMSSLDHNNTTTTATVRSGEIDNNHHHPDADGDDCNGDPNDDGDPLIFLTSVRPPPEHHEHEEEEQQQETSSVQHRTSARSSINSPLNSPPQSYNISSSVNGSLVHHYSPPASLMPLYSLSSRRSSSLLEPRRVGMGMRPAGQNGATNTTTSFAAPRRRRSGFCGEDSMALLSGSGSYDNANTIEMTELSSSVPFVRAYGKDADSDDGDGDGNADEDDDADRDIVMSVLRLEDESERGRGPLNLNGQEGGLHGEEGDYPHADVIHTPRQVLTSSPPPHNFATMTARTKPTTVTTTSTATASATMSATSAVRKMRQTENKKKNQIQTKRTTIVKEETTKIIDATTGTRIGRNSSNSNTNTRGRCLSLSLSDGGDDEGDDKRIEEGDHGEGGHHRIDDDEDECCGDNHPEDDVDVVGKSINFLDDSARYFYNYKVTATTCGDDKHKHREGHHNQHDRHGRQGRCPSSTAAAAITTTTTNTAKNTITTTLTTKSVLSTAAAACDLTRRTRPDPAGELYSKHYDPVAVALMEKETKKQELEDGREKEDVGGVVVAQGVDRVDDEGGEDDGYETYEDEGPHHPQPSSSSTTSHLRNRSSSSSPSTPMLPVTTYVLRSMINHHGKGSGSGHYTAYSYRERTVPATTVAGAAGGTPEEDDEESDDDDNSATADNYGHHNKGDDNEGDVPKGSNGTLVAGGGSETKTTETDEMNKTRDEKEKKMFRPEEVTFPEDLIHVAPEVLHMLKQEEKEQEKEQQSSPSGVDGGGKVGMAESKKYSKKKGAKSKYFVDPRQKSILHYNAASTATTAGGGGEGGGSERKKNIENKQGNSSCAASKTKTVGNARNGKNSKNKNGGTTAASSSGGGVCGDDGGRGDVSGSGGTTGCWYLMDDSHVVPEDVDVVRGLRPGKSGHGGTFSGGDAAHTTRETVYVLIYERKKVMRRRWRQSKNEKKGSASASSPLTASSLSSTPSVSAAATLVVRAGVRGGGGGVVVEEAKEHPAVTALRALARYYLLQPMERIVPWPSSTPPTTTESNRRNMHVHEHDAHRGHDSRTDQRPSVGLPKRDQADQQQLQPHDSFCYISRAWLHRLATAGLEPGMVINALCTCSASRQKSACYRHAHTERYPQDEGDLLPAALGIVPGNANSNNADPFAINDPLKGLTKLQLEKLAAFKEKNYTRVSHSLFPPVSVEPLRSVLLGEGCVGVGDGRGGGNGDGYEQRSMSVDDDDDQERDELTTSSDSSLCGAIDPPPHSSVTRLLLSPQHQRTSRNSTAGGLSPPRRRRYSNNGQRWQPMSPPSSPLLSSVATDIRQKKQEDEARDYLTYVEGNIKVSNKTLQNALHVADRSNRHFHGSVEAFYVRILRRDWERFVRIYGGGPFVSQRDVRQQKAKENAWLESIQFCANPQHRKWTQPDDTLSQRSFANGVLSLFPPPALAPSLPPLSTRSPPKLVARSRLRSPPPPPAPLPSYEYLLPLPTSGARRRRRSSSSVAAAVGTAGRSHHKDMSNPSSSAAAMTTTKTRRRAAAAAVEQNQQTTKYATPPSPSSPTLSSPTVTSYSTTTPSDDGTTPSHHTGFNSITPPRLLQQLQSSSPSRQQQNPPPAQPYESYQQQQQRNHQPKGPSGAVTATTTAKKTTTSTTRMTLTSPPLSPPLAPRMQSFRATVEAAAMTTRAPSRSTGSNHHGGVTPNHGENGGGGATGLHHVQSSSDNNTSLTFLSSNHSIVSPNDTNLTTTNSPPNDGNSFAAVLSQVVVAGGSRSSFRSPPQPPMTPQMAAAAVTSTSFQTATSPRQNNRRHEAVFAVPNRTRFSLPDDSRRRHGTRRRPEPLQQRPSSMSAAATISGWLRDHSSSSDVSEDDYNSL